MTILLEEAVSNKVSFISHLKFHQPKLAEMSRSAAKDTEQGMIANSAITDHPLWAKNVEQVVASGETEILSYLIVHGFTPECIYSQAGHGTKESGYKLS